MALPSTSGSSTPLSATTTLSSPPSPRLKGSPDTLSHGVYFNPHIPASNIIEYISSRENTTSTLYLYDLAEQVGFGALTKEWSKSKAGTAPVVDLQTRAGAGLGLIGRLSEGTSQDALKGAILTAYTTPNGLSLMSPSLGYLPPATPASRLVIQVPNVTVYGDASSPSPSLASLSTVWPMLPQNVAVLLSATPQQSADFAMLSYKLSQYHVIHIFDHQISARETGHSIAPLSDKAFHVDSVTEIIGNVGYKSFHYSGDANAHTAIVLLNGPLALAVSAIAANIPGFAVVTVNVLRPWDEDALREVLPKSILNIHVVDDVPNTSTRGSLYTDVFGTILDSELAISVHTHLVTPSRNHQFLTKKGSLVQFIHSIAPALSVNNVSLISPAAKRLLLFSSPQSPMSSLTRIIEDLFLTSKGVSARSLTDYDILSKPGGITIDRLLLSPKTNGLEEFVPIPFAVPLDSSSDDGVEFLAVLDQSLLKTHTILNYAKPGSPVVVLTTWSAEEFAANLPIEALSIAIEKNIRLFTMDAKAISLNELGLKSPSSELVQVILAYLAFLRLYLGPVATEQSVLHVAQVSLGAVVEGVPLDQINAQAWSKLEEVYLTLPKDEEPAKNSARLKEVEINAIAVDTNIRDTFDNGARLASWHDAAKHLIFPSVFSLPSEFSEEYSQNPALHPEISDRTYLVTCTVNRRLTPLEYDRNVFHLEFDTSGTGLKYAIGEALGVHGWNDEQEVLDFCAWYGVDPDRLITIPVPNVEGKVHTRTILQALQQQIDLFGHPPKSFYTDLAAFATDKAERHTLLFIGSPEGSSTFKKLSEKDTVTFADILARYTSAKPGIEKLCELIGDIKPRHYSIASAQSVVGDRVDLLVVTVDWVNSNGALRYGQCTRYLAGLRVGQKVTVSIKPSVMKLPPSPKQPIIMAGLGTGAAPFRAFLQHLALLASQGQEIGPVYYYFGSRHQASEYLYGEEIEAFMLDGVITKAGLAFSRDGPKKVYIQHKMLEDSESLAQLLHENEGVFYLCGPTWPVPDVYEALVKALAKYKGSENEAGQYLEGLKEEERYVLEVY